MKTWTLRNGFLSSGGDVVRLNSYSHNAKDTDGEYLQSTVMYAVENGRAEIVDYVEPAGDVKADALLAVGALRIATLNKYVKGSSGIDMVYAENRLAAQRYQASDAAPMSDGTLPEDYLAGMGDPLGLSATDFAQYIEGEARRLGLAAYQVEKNYLVSREAIKATDDVVVIAAAVDSYRSHCDNAVTD